MNYCDDIVSIGFKSNKVVLDDEVDVSISTDCSLASHHDNEFVIDKDDAVIIFDLSLKMISFVHRYTQAYFTSQEICTSSNSSQSINTVNCIQHSCKDNESLRQCPSRDFDQSCSQYHTGETYVK